MDLAQLTIDAAKALEGTTFEVPLPEGGTTTLKLDEALRHERPARRTRGSHVPKRESFAMYFLGAPDVLLPQGTYTLTASQAVFEQIFLVPVGRDDEATEYEAVFT
jgi:hypothetical protein